MDIESSFHALLNAFQSDVEKAKKEGADAFDTGEFEKAQIAVNRGKAAASMLFKLEQLQKEWQSPQLKSKAKKKRKRLPRGMKTAEEDFVVPILEVLQAMEGRGYTQDVLDKVEVKMKEQLQAVDYELLSDGRSIRWRNAAQWARKTMVEKGLLRGDSPRGIWEITGSGRRVLKTGFRS